MSTELAVIKNIELVPFFTKGESVDDILKAIEKEAMAHVPDTSTAKGRAAIKANVTLVTSSKTYLEGKGKNLAAEYKAIPKAIDANRKKTKEFLNDLQAKVRLPLTLWEEDQAKIKAEELAKAEAEKLKAEIESGHEFAIMMNKEIDRDIADEIARVSAELKKESERIEKERIEREKRLQLEAANNARIESERLARENNQRIEREKQSALDLAEQSRAAAELAEKNRKQAEANAEQLKRDQQWLAYITEAYNINDMLNAEEAKKVAAKASKWSAYITEAYNANDLFDAEVKRLTDIETAKQAEVRRQKYEQAAIDAANAKRAADNAHTGKIRKQAKEFFMGFDIEESKAKKMVLAISRKVESTLTINY